MHVAIVHDWLVSMRGSERVVEALCELFPDADLYTHVYDPDSVSETIRSHRVETTFIHGLPGSRKKPQLFVALMPLALQQLDLREYDLVISSESGPAKGVLTATDAVHVCYCHTPMRYVWDMYHEYLADAGRLERVVAPLVVQYLRGWDLDSATQVDHIVANSANVRSRIRKHWRRDAEIVYPPVDTKAFAPADAREEGSGAELTVAGSSRRGDSGATRDGFYLFAGRLTSYKRPDLAVEAFRELDRRLVVIGDGPERNELQRSAGPGIEFLGRQPREVLRRHYQRCRALVFPGEEDFGIVPVEAMAAGRPVIAFRRGGATESVVEGVTGTFFESQRPEALRAAVLRLESMEERLDPSTIRDHARRFDRSRFKRRMLQVVERLLGRSLYLEEPARAVDGRG